MEFSPPRCSKNLHKIRCGEEATVIFSLGLQPTFNYVGTDFFLSYCSANLWNGEALQYWNSSSNITFLFSTKWYLMSQLMIHAFLYAILLALLAWFCLVGGRSCKGNSLLIGLSLLSVKVVAFKILFFTRVNVVCGCSYTCFSQYLRTCRQSTQLPMATL